MIFEEFVGPSYVSKSIYASVERCVNFFPEVIEDPNEKRTRKVLYPTPNTGYLSGPARQVPGISRALLELNGRLFGINGGSLYEFSAPDGGAFPSGSWGGPFGPVADNGKAAFMIANGVTVGLNQQMFISSGDQGYIFTNGYIFTPLAGTTGFIGGRGAAFLNGYFATIIPGTNGVQFSNANNGLVWDARDIAYTEGQSDTLMNLIADREYLWIFGNRRSEIWYNTGVGSPPFAIQPGAFMEIGLAAAAALTQADNSLFWLGQDKRGGLSMWRANGFNPLRISNHAVETALQSYSTIDDAIAYSFLWRGHTFVRYIFPTAKAGWTYDCGLSQQVGYSVWHENSFTDINGAFYAPLERTHAYFKGYHVVGSGGDEGYPGTLYQFTDATVMADDPYLSLRFSRDGGKTYGAERQIRAGRVGEYDIRCRTNLLGQARDGVFWGRMVDNGDAVPNIDGTGGNPVTRDRICPHLSNEDKRVYYKALEFELNKGCGHGSDAEFWAVINAYLTIEPGLN